jgi:hypothetical protein
MLSERRREVRASKKKKEEGAWRGPRTLFCLVAAATASMLFLLFFAPLVQVEASAIEFVHAYDGGSNTDQANCVIEHSIDNGFALAGLSDSTGTQDMMLVKTDSVGVVLWSKTYGGSGNEWAASLIEHSIDQGLVLAGKTTSFGAGGGDMMLVKTDSMGVEIWTKAIGSQEDEGAASLIEHSSDQGLLLAGYKSGLNAADFMLVKTDSMGVEIWTKLYDGTGPEFARSVIEHSDQGLLLAGVYSGGSLGASACILMKTDAVGSELWTKGYGGPNADEAYSVIEHSIDTGLVICGTATGLGAGSDDMILVKTDSAGIEVWTKTYGGTSTESARFVIEHSIDNGLVIAGSALSFGAGSYDFMLVKTNSVGVVMWTKTYGGINKEVARSVIEHSIDNGLVVAGYTKSHGPNQDFMLVVQPSDGTSTGAGANATPIEGTQSLTDVDFTFTETTLTLTEDDVTLADADQTVTTNVVFANTPSQSPSQSQTSSQSASQSQSPSASQSQSQSASQTPTVSQTASQTSSSSVSSFASSSSSSESVLAGDLELCADGIERESCPSDDDDDGFLVLALCLGVSSFLFILVVVVRQVFRRQEQQPAASADDDTEAGAASGEAPAIELDEVDPVVVKFHTEA